MHRLETVMSFLSLCGMFPASTQWLCATILIKIIECTYGDLPPQNQVGRGRGQGRGRSRGQGGGR